MNNSQSEKKSVAIAVPFYRERISRDEKLSLDYLNRCLSRYEKYIVAPNNLKAYIPEWQVVRFKDENFLSTTTYSKLLLSPKFYKTFLNYKYILIYQLDCVVFSDQLEQWCQAGYDYIGAPLFRDKTDPSQGFSRVGNGGFSLRRVQAFLDVLESDHIPPWTTAFTTPLQDLQQFPIPYRWIKKLRVIRAARRGVGWYAHHYSLNEDLFWSDRAKLFSPGFKIAPVDVALRFAFEGHPRYCYQQNNCQLPFGAHAWAKWDRKFWDPYLIP